MDRQISQRISILYGIAVSDTDLLIAACGSKVNIVLALRTVHLGLSLADIVYDYYHNAGYSRHAIFYGNDAELVGPIRLGRLLIMSRFMYQSIFAYGSADILVNQRLLNSDFQTESCLKVIPPLSSNGCSTHVQVSTFNL
jgi:hypothetical protein